MCRSTTSTCNYTHQHLCCAGEHMKITVEQNKRGPDFTDKFPAQMKHHYMHTMRHQQHKVIELAAHDEKLTVSAPYYLL